MYLVLLCPELLQDTDILASSPDSINGDVEFQFATDEKGKLGERKLAWWVSLLDGAGATRGDSLLGLFGDERGVLRDVLEGPVEYLSAGVSQNQMVL